MQNNNKNIFTSKIGIFTIIFLILCCCCFIILAGGMGGAYYITSQLTPSAVTETPFHFNFDNSTSTPEVPPTPIEITRVPVENIQTETLKTLQESIVQVNDPIELACRLGKKCNIPETLPSGPYQAGEKKSFWVTNSGNAKSFQIQATLRYVTEHAYFWVQDGVNYNKSEAKTLVDAFETKMYPTDREFFGSEWSPGVDGDPHIYLVYARGIDATTAGYFSSIDEYHPDAKKYSNAHELLSLTLIIQPWPMFTPLVSWRTNFNT